jgi:hypothetical protein
MEKSKLIGFINRYYLAGNCEAVIVKANATGVSCDLIDSDQTVVGKVQWKTDPFLNGELGINHTATLIKMLSAVNENIDINVKESASKNFSMEIREGSTKMTFMLADTTVIPAVPNINQQPDYEVSIDLDDLFINRFIKAKNALPDAKNFAVQVKEGKIRFIINYTTINADNISFEIDGGTEAMEPIMFSSEKLKEILTANKGDMGTLHVSSNGLAKVEFHGHDFDSTYFLVQLQN